MTVSLIELDLSDGARLYVDGRRIQGDVKITYKRDGTLSTLRIGKVTTPAPPVPSPERCLLQAGAPFAIGMHHSPETFQAQCNCGWKTARYATEDDADEALARHQDEQQDVLDAREDEDA